MTKSYSAKVLDEADRSQRILDWVLFCHEQEQILYGGNEEEWRPGVFLYPQPKVRNGLLTATGITPFPLDRNQDYPGFQHESGIYGNCPRYLMEEFYEEDDYAMMRCDDCEVFWDTDEPCFSCGEIVNVPWLYPRKANAAFGQHMHTVMGFDGSENGNLAALAMDRMMFDVETYMPRFSAATDAFRAFAQSADQARPAMDSLTGEMSDLARFIREEMYIQYTRYMDHWMQQVLWGDGNGENLVGIQSDSDLDVSMPSRRPYLRFMLQIPRGHGRSEHYRRTINWRHQIDEWNGQWRSRAETERGIRRVHVPGEMVDGEYRPPVTIEIPSDMSTTPHHEVPRVSLEQQIIDYQPPRYPGSRPVTEQRRRREHG